MVSPNVRLGGGIIQIILNYKEGLKKYELVIDYAMNIQEDEALVHELTKDGAQWIQIPDKRRVYIQYLSKIRRLCRDGGYDVIHVHGNSATMAPELFLAKKYGIKKRIAHCHNTRGNHPWVNERILPFMRKQYTDALACSDKAGKWLFGENGYTVLHNAIDLERFKFSESTREQYRKKLNIAAGTVIIGHVGNFNEQKNHEFIIAVFSEILKLVKAELILIGDGYLKRQIEYNAEDLGIGKYIHFLGIRNDVEKWMDAMDLFIFPSKWEGFGMVVIEAQAVGLPVLASTEVPQDTCVTNNIKYLSLDVQATKWAETAVTMVKMIRSRKIDEEMFQSYNIDLESDRLRDIYYE